MLQGLELLGQDDDAVRVSLAGIMATRLMYDRWRRWMFFRAGDDIDLAARAAQRLVDAKSTIAWCIQDNDRALRGRWARLPCRTAQETTTAFVG